MVKSKFKNTDIGQIPEDWDLVNWNDVFDFKSTSSYSRAEIKSSGDVGYIHYGDIHTKIKATLDVNKFVSGYISNKQLKTYTSIKKGDLIMADASEDLSGVGKSFEVIESPKNPVISGLHTFLIREKKNSTLANGFKGYFYCNPLIKKQYDSLATGLKVYSLSKASFQNIHIPLPSVSEQRAIVQVLLEIDSWVNVLEKLIAKKSKLKEGAMQILLTPKEDWKVKKLGNYVKFQTGFPFPSEFFNRKNSGVRLIKNRDLRSDEAVYYFSGKYLKEFIVNNGDLLIGMDGDFEPVLWSKGFALLNQRVGRVQKIKEISIPFLSFVLVKELKKIEIITSCTTVKHLSHSDVENIELKIPSYNEQTRIASILSDMDTEIENLRIKLGKAKQLKQGIIQQLLTGKIRLVNTLPTS